MDRLPFAPEQFDVAIFNASFHYSVDYGRTLEQALRCLRRPGHLIIADSPFYSREENGQKMVTEKHAAFERRFGFRSDSVQNHEYLTPETLNELAIKLRLGGASSNPGTASVGRCGRLKPAFCSAENLRSFICSGPRCITDDHPVQSQGNETKESAIPAFRARFGGDDGGPRRVRNCRRKCGP